MGIKYKPNSTVFGAEYHITPIAMGGMQYARQLDWCTENFGRSSSSDWNKEGRQPWQSGQRWYANGDYFWFREEKDKMWYLLKWGV